MRPSESQTIDHWSRSMSSIGSSKNQLSSHSLFVPLTLTTRPSERTNVGLLPPSTRSAEIPVPRIIIRELACRGASGANGGTPFRGNCSTESAHVSSSPIHHFPRRRRQNIGGIRRSPNHFCNAGFLFVLSLWKRMINSTQDSKFAISASCRRRVKSCRYRFVIVIPTLLLAAIVVVESAIRNFVP
jgi:hypothetical protein